MQSLSTIVTPVRAATAGTVAVAGLAFSLSFTALTDLATRFGVPSSQAWAWPLIVDGLVVVATVAAAALRTHRWYAWTLLVLGALISVAGNAVHAQVAFGSVLSMLIASVPPIVLLAVTHLTVLLARQKDDEPVENTVQEPVLVAA